MDGVLFGESNCEWPFQRINITKKAVDKRRRACAPKKECSLNVLLSQGFSFGKLSLGTGILGFTSRFIMRKRPFMATKNRWIT